MRVEVLMTDGAKHIFEHVSAIEEHQGHTIAFSIRAREPFPIVLPREYIASIQVDV